MTRVFYTRDEDGRIIRVGVPRGGSIMTAEGMTPANGLVSSARGTGALPAENGACAFVAARYGGEASNRIRIEVVHSGSVAVSVFPENLITIEIDAGQTRLEQVVQAVKDSARAMALIDPPVATDGKAIASPTEPFNLQGGADDGNRLKFQPELLRRIVRIDEVSE